MKTIEITMTERIDCEPPKYVRFQINLGEIDSLPTFLKGVALEQILTSMKEKMEEEIYQHQAIMGIIKSDTKILENALTKIKKLEADKAELLEALENIVKYGGIANFDTLKSLIQKMKQ